MKTKFKSQRKGAVLATVTVVSVMMVVIIAAATQLVSHTGARTNKEYRKKQAYYVASSCLRAFISETTGFKVSDASYTQDQVNAKIKQLKDIANDSGHNETDVVITSITHGNQDISVNQPRWSNASCKLKVEPLENDNNLKVTATATYLGQEKKVVAYLQCDTDRIYEYKPRALELIGTDGSNDAKPYFENIMVYGSTGATDKESSNQNVLYKFNHNANILYGDVDINGSLVCQNANEFKSNSYYCKGVDETKGCVLNVTRSIIFSENVPVLNPDWEKDIKDQNLNPNNTESNYNYMHAGQAVILTSNNARIGKDVTKSVDTYAGLIFAGRGAFLDDNIKLAVAKKSADQSITNDEVNDFWGANGVLSYNGATKTQLGNGAGNAFYGNVYTYNHNDMFNGDMMIYDHTTVMGNIYLSGDLYIDTSTATLTVDKDSSIYLLPGHNVYYGRRNTDNNGKAAPATCEVETGSKTKNGINIIRDIDWTGNPRAQEPGFPMMADSAKPYYYYPEHLLIWPGTTKTVSTIWKQYTNMYEDDGTGHQWKLKTNEYFNLADESKFGNKDHTVYHAEDGTGSFEPKTIVTTDCYMYEMDGARVVIDLDKLPEGQKNLVVVMKGNNEGKIMNENVILVNNHYDDRFVYFVSDSGVGEVFDEYAKDGKTPSTYTPGSFNKSTFYFGGSCNVVMDLDSYLHSNIRTSSGSGALNPTANEIKDSFQLKENRIIVLATEGCKIDIGVSETTLQASVYMPRASYAITNHGCSLNINPYSKENNNGLMQSVAIIGNLVCQHYDSGSGNNNTIVYKEVSPESMLSCIKGFGEENAEESFKLIRYAAS